MSDIGGARLLRHSGARAAALLRGRYGVEVSELVGVVLPQPVTNDVVEQVFEEAQEHYALGVRPESARTWLLAMARVIVLTRVHDDLEPPVPAADDCEFLPHERTLLHLYRRSGIGVDELAEALSADRGRLVVQLARLDQRFLDLLAVRILVDEDSSGCASYSAIVASNPDRLETGPFARGHARSCPTCRELVAERALSTDVLGRPSHVAARPIPLDEHRSRPTPRRRISARALVVTAVVATIVATSAYAMAPSSGHVEQVDDAPPSAVTNIEAEQRHLDSGKSVVDVSWDAASDEVGVVGYRVWLDGSSVGTTAVRSFGFTGLSCGRGYSVGVDAFDAAGNHSGVVSVVGVTVVCDPPPSVPVVGGTYFVSVSGSDGNPGSSALPFRSLQRAADVVVAGDVVVVRDGVYGGVSSSGGCGDRPVVCLWRGGSSSARVVFRAEHRWGAVIDGGGDGSSCAGIVFGSAASYVRVEGFEVRNFACDGSVGAVESYNGAHDIEIVGNNIHDIGHVCTNTSNGQVGIYGKSSNVLIEGNWIHVVGRYGPGENGCQPSNAYYKNHDHGIYWDGTPSGLTIRNNVFETIKRGWAIQLWNGTISDVQIVHNTFVDGNPYQDGSFIVLWTGTHRNYVIRNNVFDHPVKAAIAASSSASFQNVVFDNNLLTNGAAVDIATPSGMTIGSGNLVGAVPVYAGAHDYHLAAGSPGVDSGANLGVTTDMDGRPRPAGSNPDIGAYERHP